jgi:crossover junction endodeoxyribonuclease RuvC
MQSQRPDIILGIDPGTVIMGYGIIGVASQKLSLLEMGTLKLRSTLNSYEKLERIYETVSGLIETHRPGSFAIEAPFYGKNVQSMLKLGRAQGVAIAAAIRSGLPVSEYSPKKVKQAVTGNGNASKEQIWQMLERLLHFTGKPQSFDATDAVAVAVCHHFQAIPGVPAATGGAKSWEQFIREHPEKLAGK